MHDSEAKYTSFRQQLICPYVPPLMLSVKLQPVYFSYIPVALWPNHWAEKIIKNEQVFSLSLSA